MLSLCHAFPLSLTWNVSPLQPDNYYGNGLQLHDGTLLMCGSQMLFVSRTIIAWYLGLHSPKSASNDRRCLLSLPGDGCCGVRVLLAMIMCAGRA